MRNGKPKKTNIFCDCVSVRMHVICIHRLLYVAKDVNVLAILTGQTLIYPCQSGSLPTNQLSSFYLHLPPPGRWKLNVAVILGQLGAF